MLCPLVIETEVYVSKYITNSVGRRPSSPLYSEMNRNAYNDEKADIHILPENQTLLETVPSLPLPECVCAQVKPRLHEKTCSLIHGIFKIRDQSV